MLLQPARAQGQEMQQQPLTTTSGVSSTSQFQANTLTAKNNASKTSSSSNYLTYQNPFLGIRIKYPPGWLVQEYAYSNSASSHVVAGFFSPSKTGSELGNVSGVSGLFVPYVDILIFPSNGTSLDNLVQEKINNFLNNSDFTINKNETKPFMLNGNHPAYMLDYVVTVGGDEFFRKSQAWTIFGDNVYVITFTSQQSLFADYIRTVEKMINSFQVQTRTK
jgi:serine/threonine-protein kinase